MQTLDQLNASFSIPGVLSFDERDGLLRACISTPTCGGELYLHGAHVTAWQPIDHEPALFLSEASAFAPDRAIRGGIPIVFPWFGKRTATPAFEGQAERTDGPAHGFARIQSWNLDFAAYAAAGSPANTGVPNELASLGRSSLAGAADELHLSLSLAPTDLSRSLGYDKFLLAYQITFGKQLKLRLSIANDGDTPMRIEEALHTYLHVADVEQARVHGLYETEYLDKADNFARKTQTDPVLTFHGPTDRLYLNTASPIVVDDPLLHRRITVTKSNSNTTVIWNPWDNAGLADMSADGWRAMLCVESANALENSITLHPHEAHVMETTVSISTLTPTAGRS